MAETMAGGNELIPGAAQDHQSLWPVWIQRWPSLSPAGPSQVQLSLLQVFCLGLHLLFSQL